MRILYFTRDYTTHDHRFLASLVSTEHEIFYLRLEKRVRQLEDRPFPEGVKVVHWVGGKKKASLNQGMILFLSLKQVIQRIKPDVIHAGPIQTSAFLTALSGFHPLVSMSWGSDLLKDAEENYWKKQATRFALKHTDILIADCQNVKNKAISLGMREKDIVTFPWGIDLRCFSPRKSAQKQRFRTRWGWEDKYVILHLRSWEPVYGVDVMAKAFVIAAKQNPDLRLLLPGGGSMISDLRRIFTGGGVVDKIEFVGQISQTELPEYFHNADLYLSASHSDGSSVSMMEALGSGLPVLLSDVPSNQEWIKKEGEAGWLFKDGDEKELADKILLAAESSRSERNKMAASARQLAEERADWQKNFNTLLEAYEMALRKKD
ncbi:MAG: glycosyltransferase family 4 protein [Anaerolineales bacterium]|nr:glycosyltransferase family 4 protein [Anaerolineales bacterium]